MHPAHAVALVAVLLPALAAGAVADKPSPDAAARFATQTGQVVDAPGPRLTGAFLWGGRADSQYRPFHQWDVRLAAGSGGQMRIVTLGAGQEVIITGGWKPVTADPAVVPYRLNGPTFAAYRVEWQRGSATCAWVAGDKVGLPVPILAGQPCLIVAGADAEPANAAKQPAAAGAAVVTGGLWNLGDTAAQGVELSIVFKDESLKTVKTHKQPVPGGTVPPGYNKPFRIVVPKAGPFAAASVSASHKIGGVAGFTGAKDVEVAHLSVTGTPPNQVLHGRVRNGTATAQRQVALVITLLNDQGKSMGEVRASAGNLAVGEEKPFTAPFGATLPTTFAATDLVWTGEAP